MLASTPSTRGRSRIRESRTYGSVRGAPGKRRSYREQRLEVGEIPFAGLTEFDLFLVERRHDSPVLLSSAKT